MSISLTTSQVNVDEKKDASPSVKDMAHKLTMKLMENPKFKDQITKIKTEKVYLQSTTYFRIFVVNPFYEDQ